MTDFRAPKNPLTDREERIIEANSELNGSDCPECGRTVEACDLSQDGTLYVAHEDDVIDHRADDDEDGCYVSYENDPTVSE